MSGGVDSSVAAALLLRAGYDVVGCFMRLGSPGETLDAVSRDDACRIEEAGPTSRPAGGGVKVGHQGCCSINDAADARQVAAELGIPFYVVNFKRDFGRVISYFVDEYVRGRTPNPCVRCNDWLKFGKLHEYAVQIGATSVASGHYARIDRSRGQTRLLRGIDHSKDQSYVLFGAPRERLGSMLLPIGDMEKARVRELARELGLPVFDKPDSQEICFVPDNDYAGLVERVAPEQSRPGPVVDQRGHVVGTHHGQHRFTIGQRRGVGLALGAPAYVLERDAATNTVRIGPPEALAVTSVVASEANWLIEPPTIGDDRPCLVRYRSNGAATSACVRPLRSDECVPTPSGRAGTFEVLFDEPQRAVAPGQAVVLYDSDDPNWVIGGGWITSAKRVD